MPVLAYRVSMRPAGPCALLQTGFTRRSNSLHTAFAGLTDRSACLHGVVAPLYGRKVGRLPQPLRTTSGPLRVQKGTRNVGTRLRGRELLEPFQQLR